MSVLLVAPPAQLAGPIIEHLIAQEDEVRVVADEGDVEGWRRLGAHVARGAPDADLLARAGQSSRTITLFDPVSQLVHEAIEAALAARIERVVAVLSRPSSDLAALLAGSGLSYVVLLAARRGLRRPAAPAAIAAAIDAADDLAGNVRLEVDLADPDGWNALGIER